MEGRELPRGFISVRDANYLASNRYRPGEYQGKVTLFRAEEERVGRPMGRTLGWENFALGGVEVIDVPGTHTSLILEPHVQILARQLRTALYRMAEANPADGSVRLPEPSRTSSGS